MVKPSKQTADIFEEAKRRIQREKETKIRTVVTLTLTEEELDKILESIK